MYQAYRSNVRNLTKETHGPQRSHEKHLLSVHMFKQFSMIIQVYCIKKHQQKISISI